MTSPWHRRHQNEPAVPSDILQGAAQSYREPVIVILHNYKPNICTRIQWGFLALSIVRYSKHCTTDVSESGFSSGTQRRKLAHFPRLSGCRAMDRDQKSAIQSGGIHHRRNPSEYAWCKIVGCRRKVTTTKLMFPLGMSVR